MIATMNQCSWIGVLILGAVCIKRCILAARSMPAGRAARSSPFTALLMLPVAIFYRPKDEQLAEAPA